MRQIRRVGTCTGRLWCWCYLIITVGLQIVQGCWSFTIQPQQRQQQLHFVVTRSSDSKQLVSTQTSIDTSYRGSTKDAQTSTTNAIIAPPHVFSNRRTWFNMMILASSSTTTTNLLLPRWADAASIPSLTLFNDQLHNFSIQIPSNWISSEQKLRDRRTMRLWMDPTDATTALFIAYTPIRDDFTSLGSFGSVDQVASQTILPKGEIAGVDNVIATMLSATASKQAYFFDYQQEIPSVQPNTHFRTIFTLQPGATGGAGSVLVAITAQTSEVRYQTEMKPIFDAIIDSYGKSIQE